MKLEVFYNRSVLNGRKLFLLFFLTAIVLRLLYIYHRPEVDFSYTDSYLWSKIHLLFNNTYLSLSLSFVCILLIALLVNSAGVSISMFRVRTILPAAMCLLMFSSSIIYVVFSPYIVVALFFTYILYLIYTHYDGENSQYLSLRVGFYTSLATLISSSFIYYIPILFYCLYLSRNFSIKSFVSFLLGFIPIYILLFSLSIYFEDLSAFIYFLKYPFHFAFNQIPLLDYSLSQYLALGFCVFTMIVMMFNLKFKDFGEKVIIRVCVSIISFLQLYSIFLIVLIASAFYCGITILLATFCLSLPYIYLTGKNKKILIGLLIFNYASTIFFYSNSLFHFL